MVARVGGDEHLPQVLARGPWELHQITARWLESSFEPTAAQNEAADAAIRGLAERGSPSHDGVAARLAGFHANDHGIELELQPQRWALRLVEGIPEWLSPLATVIPGQVAAFRLAQLTGSDLDNPHGLSKVTLTL